MIKPSEVYPEEAIRMRAERRNLRLRFWYALARLFVKGIKLFRRLHEWAYDKAMEVEPIGRASNAKCDCNPLLGTYRYCPIHGLKPGEDKGD